MTFSASADLLRQNILLRLEKQKRGKAAQPDEPAVWAGTPLPTAQPAGSGSNIGFPSPNQVHGAKSDLNKGETRIADTAQHGPEYAAGKNKADKEQHMLGDAMTPLASSAGRPSAEELNQWVDHPPEDSDPALQMAGILHGVASDQNTHYGKFLSQYSEFARKHVAEAAQLFRTLSPHVEALAKNGHQISSLAPVFDRMLEIRNELASGVPMGDHRNELIREYASHADNLDKLKQIANKRRAKDAVVPFYPDDEGYAVDKGGSAPTFKEDQDREGEIDKDEEPKEETQKKSRSVTQKAKDAKFGAAKFINSHWHDVLRSMRLEMSEDNYKQQIADAKAEIQAKNLPPEVADAEFQRLRGGIIDVWRKKLNAYYKLEDILSSAQIGAQAITSAGDHGLKNFASWYTAGATRTMASIVDLINTSPAYKALRGKVGRIARFDTKTGQEHEQGDGYRLQFDSPEQAKAAVMIAALIGPTSANEKPSNNVRIALSLIEDGLYQFHRKYANDPERLARGPSIMETLALAKHDRAHLGIYSEFGHQQPYKYFSGLYHTLTRAEQLKHAKKFATLLFNRSERGKLPSNEAIREQLLQENDGFYYRPAGSKTPALIPMKRAKVAGVDWRQVDDETKQQAPLSEYIMAAQELEPNASNRALVEDLIALAERKKPAASEPVYVGHEPEAEHGGKAALRLIDGKYQPLPKSISSRPGSARQFLSLMRMFQHGADVAMTMPDASPEERKKAISAAILTHTDPESGKSLFDQLALSEATLKGMYGGVAGLKDANKKHADAIAEAIANSPGKEHDAIGSMFLAGVHEHPVLNKIIPVSHDSWFTGGDKHPYDGDYEYHANTNDQFSSKVPGMNVLGPKFGPYALGVSHPALQAMHHLMGGITLPDEKYVADRVMMELHSDALGRRFGGVPESEMQRAAFNHGVKHLGKVLGRLFGGGPLSIGKLQAITWGATQAAVSSLGGNNPTEQLYTGAERAWALHKVHAHRVLEHYKKFGDKNSPEIKQMLAEYEAFLHPSTQALRLRSAKDGVAYAMLQDVPYAAGQALGADREAEQQRTLDGMSHAGKLVTAAFRDAGKKAKHFSKGATHASARPGDSRGVRADRGQDQRADGKGIRRQPAHGAGTGSRAGAPANPLAGGAPQPAQRRGASSARRDGATGAASHVSAAPGARPERLKYSTQFMRAMLLGTSASAQKFRQQLDGIARQIGVRVRSYNGVGDGIIESAPATAHVSHQPVDPDTAKYLGAWAGLLGDRRSVMVFHPDAKGTDSLYSIRLPLTDMQDVRAALDKYGLKHRTVIPGGKTTHVMVYDPQRIMRAQVEQLAGEHDAHVFESAGRAEFLGRPANSGADSGESREHYRRIIADYEERRGVPNQAGAAADGGGSGPPVPGAAAAGRSPAGGSIVRGVTYKGGKFTPAAEQKAAPAPQEGGPERFRKTLRLRYNRQKSLAEQGAQHYDPMLDAASSPGSSVALKAVEQSHSPRGLGNKFQPDITGMGRTSGAASTPAQSFDTAPENAWQTIQRASEPTPGGLTSAARQLHLHSVGRPVALPPDIDALRHLVSATAGQGITPHERYAEFLKTPGIERTQFGKHLDELHKILGTACAGNPRLMEVLKAENPRPVNHNAPLAPGVTRVGGTLVPHPHVFMNGFLPSLQQGQFMRSPESDPGSFAMRFAPDAPVRHGVIDSVNPGGNGIYYATPDGRVFLHPEEANNHVLSDPRVRGLQNIAHLPWMTLKHRIQSYSGADHVIEALLRHPTLSRLETDIREPAARYIEGGATERAMKLYRQAFEQEPGRVRALLDLLGEHFGQHKLTNAFGMSGITDKPGVLAGTVAKRDQGLPADAGLAVSHGAKRRNELVDMAQRFVGLFNRDVYGSAHPLQMGLGTIPARMRGSAGSTSASPIGLYDDQPWQKPDDLRDQPVHPMQIIGLAQTATPAVLAHEVAHMMEMQVPGIARATSEHALMHRADPLHQERGRVLSRNKVVMAPTDMPWLPTQDAANYAHVLAMPFVQTHSRFDVSPRRDLYVGHDSSEYFPQMFGEFVSRPVRMAREYPHVARFIFGLMNGALRSHQ